MSLTYLHNRNGTYYFRMALSETFKRRFGQRELLYSLHTKSYPEGRRRCLTLARMAHDLLMKLEQNQTLTPEQVRGIARAYFSEGLARLRTHVNNVDKAFSTTEAATSGDEAKLAEVNKYLQAPYFYLPDSMNGVLARNSKGEVTSTSFKVGDVPLTMKPVTMDDILGYVMNQNRLKLSPQGNPFKRLNQGINQAVNELEHLHQQYCAFEEPRVTDDMFRDLLASEPSTPTITVTHIPASKPFSEVVKAYADDVKGANGKLTLARKQLGYKWFINQFGDLPIQTITKLNHANAFKAMLGQKRSHASKYKASASTTATPKTLSTRSQAIYLSALRSLFKWAIDQGYYEGQNPFSNIAPPKTKPVAGQAVAGPYSETTLKAIFSSPIYTGHKVQRIKAGPSLLKDSLYWVPLIALFSGARREEICQLRTKDIRQEQGVWVLDINLNDAGKNLKNAQSARLVPIHAKLIELGFITYAQGQKDKLLFPDITFSKSKDRFGDSFGRQYARALERLKISEPKKNFHSFRHTMIDAMRAADVEEGKMSAIAGHKPVGQTGSYGKGYPIKVLKEAVDKVQYPFIDWKKVGVVKV